MSSFQFRSRDPIAFRLMLVCSKWTMRSPWGKSGVPLAPAVSSERMTSYSEQNRCIRLQGEQSPWNDYIHDSNLLNQVHSPVQFSRRTDTDAADEQRLVAEVLAKDRKATAEFVARCADWLYSFVRHRLAPRTEIVADLVQEALLSAWQGLR